MVTNTACPALGCLALPAAACALVSGAHSVKLCLHKADRIGHHEPTDHSCVEQNTGDSVRCPFQEHLVGRFHQSEAQSHTNQTKGRQQAGAEAPHPCLRGRDDQKRLFSSPLGQLLLQAAEARIPIYPSNAPHQLLESRGSALIPQHVARAPSQGKAGQED